MRLLNRYIAKEIYFGTFLVTVALGFLFGLFDFIHELNDIGKGGYQLAQILLFVLLSVPGHIYELFPIAVLIGTLYGLGQLTTHSEMTVMRASGMSRFRLGGSLIKAGLLFVVLTLLVGEWVMPVAEKSAQELRLKALNNFVTSQFRSGIWAKDSGRFINVQEMLPDGSLKGVRIYQFDTQHHLVSISTAQQGHYTGHEQWRLEDVDRTYFEGNQVRGEHINEIQWNTPLTPDLMTTLLVQPEQMSLVNLFKYVKHLRENSQQSVRFEIAGWSKLIYPLSTLVMMQLALPFSLHRPRTGTIGGRIMMGIVLGLVYYLVNHFFDFEGQLYNWNVVLTTTVPLLTFMLLSLGLGWWVERRA